MGYFLRNDCDFNLRLVESQILSVASHSDINPPLPNILFVELLTRLQRILLTLKKTRAPSIRPPLKIPAQHHTATQYPVVFKKRANFLLSHGPGETTEFQGHLVGGFDCRKNEKG